MGVNLLVINKDRVSSCRWWWLGIGDVVDACSCLPSTSRCSIHVPPTPPHLLSNPAEGGLLENSPG